MNFIREKKGSVLIESIVGISLVTVGILGIIMLLTSSSGFYNSAVNNLKAAYLAAEGIEVMKNVIDSNYVKNGNVWSPPSDGWYYLDYRTPDAGSPLNLASPAPAPANARLVKFDSSNGGVFLSPDSPSGVDTVFGRIVRIQSVDNYKKVTSFVSWKEGGSQKQVQLEDHFYKWRP